MVLIQRVGVTHLVLLATDSAVMREIYPFPHLREVGIVDKNYKNMQVVHFSVASSSVSVDLTSAGPTGVQPAWPFCH